MPKKTLVCRCEDVTLHELEAALERGHRDMESVKRYTGFGTGWCQGKSCLALCARLVHERGGDASEPFKQRPPYHPVPLATLAALADLDLSGGGPPELVHERSGKAESENESEGEGKGNAPVSSGAGRSRSRR